MNEFDFSTFISDHTRGFTGRQWVLVEIDRWLDEPAAPQLFILTGEPGVGKSAIAARLTQVRRVDAAHFCIARQASTLDPLNFARSISRQLTTNDAFAIHLLADQGLHLDVSLDVQKNYGQVIGVQIEHLVINAPSAGEAFNRAVIDPIQAMYRDGYASRLVVLVDALDEAMQFFGRQTIIDLLANLAGLPPQVRFILTSRPEHAVLRHFEQRGAPYFLLDAGRPENLLDIRAYIRNQIAALPGLKTQLDSKSIAPADFEEVVTTSSQGNFLYLTWLLPGVASGTQPVDDLTRLPVGLDGIYREFLRNRTLGSDIRQWRFYRPLLGVLAVARAALTNDQLANFTGLNPQEVSEFVLDASQFLDPVAAPAGRCQLYHQSLVDFLVDRQRAEEFWIDPQGMHHLIVRFYRGRAPTWAGVDWHQVDDYGLLYLGLHLYALKDLPEQRDGLYGLVCRPFMQAKRTRSGSQRAFASDVALALQIAESPPEPDLDQVIRLSLLYSTLGSLATQVAPETLALLAGLGRVAEAEDFAALIQVKEQQSQAYLGIAQVLLEGGNLEAARRLAVLASEAALAIGEPFARAVALKRAVPLLAQTGSHDQAAALVDQIEKRPAQVEAMRDLAQALASTGAFELALQWVEKLGEADERIQALVQVAGGLAQAGDFKRALQVVAKIRRQPEKERALSAVATSMAQRGLCERASQVAKRIHHLEVQGPALNVAVRAYAQAGRLEEAFQLAMSIPDEPSRVGSLGGVAAGLAQAGDFERFSVTLESMTPERLQAVEVARSACAAGATDPWGRAFVNLRFAQLLREAGDAQEAGEAVQRALQAAREIPEAQERLPMLQWVAESLAGPGRDTQVEAVLDEAQVAVREVAGAEVNLRLQLDLAQTEAQLGYGERAAGRIDQALSAVLSWDDPAARYRNLGGIALFLAQAGDRDRALAVLGRIAPPQDIPDPEALLWATLDRIPAYLQLDELQKAQEALQAALPALEATGVGPSQANAWIDLAYYAYQIEAGSYQQVLGRAGAAAQSIEPAAGRADALVRLCRLASYGPPPGQYDYSLSVNFYIIFDHFISQASQAAARIEDPADRVTRLASLVGSLFPFGEADIFWRDELQREQAYALSLLDSLVKEAQALDEPDQRSLASSRVAEACRLAGRFAQARQLLAGAVVAARQVPDVDDRAYVLSEASRVMADLARDEAIQPARINALIEVAQALSWLGEHERAAGLAGEALAAAVQSGRYELEKVMMSFALSGQFEQALALAEAHEKPARGADQSENTLKVLLDILPADRPAERGLHLFVSEAPVAMCAASLARAGDFEEAMRMVATIRAGAGRDAALIQVGQALVKLGAASQAEEITNRLLASSESLAQDEAEMVALGGISRSLLDAHRLEQAIAVSEAIRLKDQRLEAVQRIIQNLAAAGHLPRALDLAEGLADPYSQVTAMNHIVRTLVRLGQKEPASQVLERAEKRVGRIKSRRDCIASLAQVASQWSRLGEEDKAQTRLGQALAQAQAKEVRSNRDKLAVETALIGALVEMGREGEAAGRIEPALQVAARFKERQQALLLKELVLALSLVAGGKIFNQVDAQIRKIRSRRDRLVALSGVVLALGRAGQVQAALALAEGALKIAGMIQNERDRLSAWREVVRAAAELGEAGRGWSGLQRLLDIAGQVRDGRAKVEALRTALWAAVQPGSALEGAQSDGYLLDLFLRLMDASRLVGRQAVFAALADSAPFLAQQDHGDTLWQAYQSIQEIDGWWASK